MPTRIGQLLAILTGLQNETKAATDHLGAVARREDLFSGLDKTYAPATETDPGSRPPRNPSVDQHKKVQVTADAVLAEAARKLTRLWDVQLTVDAANQQARADVVVDGVTLAADVPQAHLLYLSRELSVIEGIVKALPVLDGTQEWSEANAEPGQHRSAPEVKPKTEKVPWVMRLTAATDKFPETVQVMSRDDTVEWATTVNYSGALYADRKALLLERVSLLQAAVKMAREEANSAVVTDRHAAAALFAYLLAE